MLLTQTRNNLLCSSAGLIATSKMWWINLVLILSVEALFSTSPKIIGHRYDQNLSLWHLVNGTDLKFQCIATGFPEPKITWTKGGDKHFLSVGPMLHFPSITRADNGQYFCSADNGIGKTAQDSGTYIEVRKYKPMMKYDSIPIRTVTQADINNNSVDGKMKVLVHGCPEPTVTWWKETENGRKRITEGDNSIEHGFNIHDELPFFCERDSGHILEMDRFKQTDLGTYVVKTESSLGIVELKFTIRLDTDLYAIWKS